MKFRSLILTFFFLASVVANSQAQKSLTPNTLTAVENQMYPKATINQMKWIVGEYECEAFGGIAHEVWTSPRANNMMGAFQLISERKVSFYELMTIIEERGSLILRLKHFDSKLHGWEEKDETEDFELLKMTDKMAFFDGLTFEYVSRKAINVYVAIGDGKKIEEAKFAYKKVKRKR